MERTVVVQGNLSDPRHIELDESRSGVHGRAQVTVYPLEEQTRMPLFESATQEEWQRTFNACIQAHDRTVPIPFAESLGREEMYEDR